MKSYSWIFILALIFITAAFFWLFINVSKTKTLPTPQEEVKIIDDKKLDKIEKLNNPSQSINIENDPDFGRVDPFAPY